MADVKCGLYEINKNNRANATHEPSLVQKMFRDQTESMLDCRGPGTGPGTVLTLVNSVLKVPAVAVTSWFDLVAKERLTVLELTGRSRQKNRAIRTGGFNWSGLLPNDMHS